MKVALWYFFCWWFTSIAQTSFFMEWICFLTFFFFFFIWKCHVSFVHIKKVRDGVWVNLHMHGCVWRMAPSASPTYHVAHISPSEREREGGSETTHWVGTRVQIRLPLAVPGGPLLCWWFFNDPSLATGSLYCLEWRADGKSWWVNLTYQKRVERGLFFFLFFCHPLWDPISV